MGIMVEHIHVLDLTLNTVLYLQDEEGTYMVPRNVDGLLASDREILICWRDLGSNVTQWEAYSGDTQFDSSSDGYHEQEALRREVDRTVDIGENEWGSFAVCMECEWAEKMLTPEGAVSLGEAHAKTHLDATVQSEWEEDREVAHSVSCSVEPRHTWRRCPDGQ